MAGGEQISRRRPRLIRALIALTILIGVALLSVWLARVPIAERFVDRTLAARSVPARYTVADLGFGRQRLTDVVIGDPRDPDLVADWVETYTDVTSAGPRVSGVRAGHVRLRARLAGGRVSLGALDRLLPAPSGKPFALPAITLDVRDARVRLETAVGIVGLRISGHGKLDDGFRGSLAMAGRRLRIGDCTIAAPQAVLTLRVEKAAPALAGPVRAGAARCGGTTLTRPGATIELALRPALDRWSGAAMLRIAEVASGGAQVSSLAGRIGFAGSAARTEGEARLQGQSFAAAGVRGAWPTFAGSWRLATGRAIAAGRFDARAMALPAAIRAQLGGAGRSAAGTPIAPLAAKAGTAAARAAALFAIGGDLALGNASGRLLAIVRQLDVRADSGARLSFADGAGLVMGDPAGLRADGVLAFGGGGLPEGRVTLRQPHAGAQVRGVATIAPYAAGDARLALEPARFTLGAGGTVRLASVARLSGPLGDGRVDGLRLPVTLRQTGGALVLNDACAPLAFDRLTVAGLMLASTRLSLCPVDGALLRYAGGRIAGGASVASPRLVGALGGSPLTLAAARAEWRHARAGFVLTDVAARLGRADRVTRLDLAQVDGRVANGAVAGRFAGGAGQIGNVPLLLSAATGDWRLRGGALALDGALTVADAQADAPRFRPLAARGVSLRLANGAISAGGALYEPAKNVRVADVTLRHALSSGRGAARLAVPGVTFGDGFQPEELTRLTFGVIADVRGTVSGAGDIAWSPDGVTSTGTFRTDGTDLAAAFGPVTGIKGEIRFTDLLALESAPDQVATVTSINPGVAVTDGRITYQTLAGTRIAVRGGRWPFAGGTLTLAPTLLDFSSPQERRMTFRVDGMEAAQFLQQFDFKNLNATGVFDGELPMVFDERGGRIENGTLVVREGGGTLAYVGDLTEKDLGIWGNIAFQALKSLRYRNLNIVMNGPLAGEMITEVRFAGVTQGEGAKSNFLIRRLQRLPFVFNVRIKAPFRGLIDSAASFYDPKRLIERNLPALLDEQNKRADPTAIQPPASEKMP